MLFLGVIVFPIAQNSTYILAVRYLRALWQRKLYVEQKVRPSSVYVLSSKLNNMFWHQGQEGDSQLLMLKSCSSVKQ